MTRGSDHVCSPWTATAADCGNGVLDPGEECDPWSPEEFSCTDFPGRSGIGYCDDMCLYRCQHACGDGILQGSEQCDDGNLADDDGCTADCQDEPLPWQELTPTDAPSPRSEHAMAYDSARDLVVLFGGNTAQSANDTVQLGDTWVFDGVDWHELDFAPDERPSPRHGHAMVYDEARGVTLLVGGWDGLAEGASAELWELDGDCWRRGAEDAPLGLWRAGLAVDDQARAIYFGGSTTAFGGGDRRDTYRYDGEHWQLLESLVSPRKRIRHAMSSAEGVILLHGGYYFHDNHDQMVLGDTWLWEQAQWRRTAWDIAAPESMGHALAYYPPWNKYLLFGGWGPPTFDLFGHSWLFDVHTERWLRAWTPTAPSPRWLHRMVLDTARDRILLFGGRDDNGPLGDTWVVEP